MCVLRWGDNDKKQMRYQSTKAPTTQWRPRLGLGPEAKQHTLQVLLVYLKSALVRHLSYAQHTCYQELSLRPAVSPVTYWRDWGAGFRWGGKQYDGLGPQESCGGEEVCTPLSLLLLQPSQPILRISRCMHTCTHTSHTAVYMAWASSALKLQSQCS